MNDDFLERLRSDAQQLRYEPEDELLWVRLSARIRDRVQVPPSVPQLLTLWFRPITASLVMLVLVAALSITWLERTHESTYTLEAMSTNSVEITLDGDTYNLAE